MSKNQNQYKFESTDLIVYMWKRRIPLIIITVAAAIISILVSLTITPKFKSMVVLFPASESPVSKTLLQTNFQDRVGILGFGEEEQLERLLQVLHSDAIRDKIIEKYNLMEHYEIDSTGPFPRTKLFAEYKSNIKFKRTEYNSIVIEVLDKDPQMAADIANDIAYLIDYTMSRMKHDRAMEAYRLVEMEYEKLEDEVESIKDSLAMLHRKGMILYEEQTERLVEAYAKAKVAGNYKGAENLKKDFDVLEKYSGTFVYYRALLTHESNRLSELKSKYAEAKAEASQNLANVFILDKAYKAEKKAYPKKSIIVIVATFSTFILAVMAFLFFENFLKKIRV